ncbi:MAG TPA: chemotaxis protein CheA [Gammaproteobacteria bacterium]|nr:chemotaxis protein CheA [Gammaproteobacteria bacterium]
MDADDDILQDFLVEAGEILEQLGEQLIGLEQCPDDPDILNAVFRGFHTVKGGAGFLSIVPLVEVCHRAEDVFNVLRQGQRQVDADLMDVVFKVVDVVNVMMDAVRNGEQPEPADPALLKTLEDYTQAAGTGPRAAAPAPAEEAPAASASEADPADAAFDAMLDAVDDAPAADEAASGPASDDITEEEFEALLDELHGAVPAARPDAQPDAAAPASGSDDITEEEFEALLDQLHGPAPAAKAAPAPAPAEPAAAPLADAARDGPPPAAAAPSPPPSAVPAPSPEKPAGRKPLFKDGGGTQAETTVRVDTRRLDDIMNLVGELVLVRNRMATLKSSMEDDEIAKAVANLDLVTADLQSAVMKTRMQPIKKVFGRFPRVVRDLSRSLGKEINLEVVGEETDLDKNLVEALADPLVHLVRNAVDHGIETPDVREAAGKDRVGNVLLSACQEGDHILLTIEDDGAGMDANRLREKAVEKGLLDADSAARLDDKECYNLIFHPGFSTKTEISDVSGRGVGMDVVKTRITQLNGSVEIDSELGRGSKIKVKLPLTLAIVPTLMVMLDRQIFALPLANVSEIIQMDSAQTSVVDGQQVAVIREHTLPLFYLRKWLVQNAGPDDGAAGYVVVVQIGDRQIACVVDQLIAQEEVVIKPLGALLQGTPGLAGATITGDGRIALILDMPSLMSGYAARM